MELLNVSCAIINFWNTWMNNSFVSLSATEVAGANLTLTCRVNNCHADWYKNGEMFFQTNIVNNECTIIPKSNEYNDFSRQTSLSCDGTMHNVTLSINNGGSTRTDWQCGLKTRRSNIIQIGEDMPEIRTGVTLVIAGSAAGPVCICIVVVAWILTRRRSSSIGTRKPMNNTSNAAISENDTEEIEMVDNQCYAGVTKSDPEKTKNVTSLTIP